MEKDIAEINFKAYLSPIKKNIKKHIQILKNREVHQEILFGN